MFDDRHVAAIAIADLSEEVIVADHDDRAVAPVWRDHDLSVDEGEERERGGTHGVAPVGVGDV